jgi:hypothetical protein
MIAVIAIAASVAVLLLLSVILVFCCCKYCSERNSSTYTPLMPERSPAYSNGGTEMHSIGSPYSLKHDSGDSPATNNLVSREEFSRKQNYANVGSTGRAGAGAPPPGERVMRFRLIADVRDAGEGVLTGARLGEFAEVLEKDYTDSDWVWATIGGRSGWCPRNHLGKL